jgi:hypothetical protein
MKRALYWLFLVTALVVVALAVHGVIASYSPVPFMDMWDGTLGFFLRVQDGDWHAWLEQHNEHRIVLSRILFLLDFSWFDGSGWSLLATNVILLSMLAALFTRFVSEAAGDQYRWFGWFTVGWLFLWSQSENLTWGFQSQLYFAYLLPLAAFYLLHRLAQRPTTRSMERLIASLACGIAALGSMAYGALALPLMAVFAWLVGMPRRHIALIAAVAALCISAYFTRYTNLETTDPIGVTLLSDPVGLLRHLALLLGSPLYFLAGESLEGRVLAEAGGFVLMLASGLVARIVLGRHPRSTVDVALLCFLAYVGISVVAMAAGRLKVGLEFPLSGRHTTPALLAWATLAVLWLSQLKPLLRPGLVALPLLAVLCVMLLRQAHAVEASNDASRFERSLAAMALELGVRDEPTIKAVFPFVDGALQISAKASARDVGVFGLTPFRGARELIGSHRVASAAAACVGHLDEVRPVPTDPAYAFVRGWLSDRSGAAASSDLRRLLVLDGTSQVVGVLIHGQRRDDVANAIDISRPHVGFSGYVLRTALSSQVHLEAESAQCATAVALPALSLSLDARRQLAMPGGPSPSVNDNDRRDTESLPFLAPRATSRQIAL